MHEYFGEVIHRYTREQAIADGVLVDVSTMAAEAGFIVPVAITAAVEADLMNVPPGAVGQSYDGRLWDALFMAAWAIKRSAGSESGASQDPLTYAMHLPVGNPDSSNYRLKLHSGPGDNAEHVITIMKPNED